MMRGIGAGVGTLGCAIMAFAGTAALADTKEPVFLIEAESADDHADWVLVQDAGASGGAYLHYRGENRYKEGEWPELNYCVDVAQPGDYGLTIRMRRSRLDDPDHREDLRNDIWVRMTRGQMMKLYTRTEWEEWGWGGRFDFHHLNGYRPEARLRVKDAGSFCFFVAGRSEQVQLDQLRLERLPDEE